MPRRLPEKVKLQERWPRRFNQKNWSYRVAFQQKALVKERQELEVIIDDTGSRRDEAARIHGFFIFVPKTKTSERLKVKTVKVNRRFTLAEEANETGGEN